MIPTQVVGGAIEIHDNAIDNSEELLEFVVQRMNWNEARVGVGGGEVNKNMRDNDVSFFPMLSFSHPDMLNAFGKRIWTYINDYAIRYNFTFSGVEYANINKYEPGERYLPHADDGPGNNRVVSALLYLNDVEVGGETEFLNFDVSVKPKAGRLVIFPSNYAYVHAAHPPISGTKYSIAIWCHK